MLEGKVWPSLILGSAHRGVLWPVPIQSIRVGNASAGGKAGGRAGRQGDNSAGSVKSLVSACADEAKGQY